MKGLLLPIYNWFAYPHRLAAIRPFVGAPHPRVLDIGCGNHSPKTTKRYMPDCIYHGVDNRRWNRDDEDDRLIDRFFDIDLDSPGCLAQIPGGYYDVVICSHVLEHLCRPYDLVGALVPKLASGGVLFIEVPSRRSLKLPRAARGWLCVRGCLNFADDETHKTMVDLERVTDILRESGLDARDPATSVLWRRILLLPLYLVAALAVKGFVPASLLWDICGFARSVTAVARKARGPLPKRSVALRGLNDRARFVKMTEVHAAFLLSGCGPT